MPLRAALQQCTRCSYLITLTLLLASQLCFGLPSSQECAAVMDDYLNKHHKEAAPWTGDNMVYFLHVPRTAGRTFHACMLKLGTHPDKRCPKAYDHLRVNMSAPECQLLSSHDDFSIVSMLPENTAVLTHVRDPVDRFLSAYEFGLEISARQAAKGPQKRKSMKAMSTEDVWPWSYLIPYFAESTRARMLKVQEKYRVHYPGNWIRVAHPDGSKYFYNDAIKQSKWHLTAAEKELLLPDLDMYDNPIVISLRDFARTPIARELLHNGAAYQVLGITNYSHWGDAAQMRECIEGYPTIQDQMIAVAKNRLHLFTHVGTTDKLWDSAESAAASFNFSLVGPAYQSTADGELLGMIHGEGNLSATDLPFLGTKVREARLELMKQQKRLTQAIQAASSEQEMVALKDAVNEARNVYRKHQEVLITLKASLPDPSAPAKAASETPPAPPPAMKAAAKLMRDNLGTEFQRCANRAQGKNMERKENALNMLVMPDGRGLEFNKQVRSQISQDIIDLIREINPIDTAIHQAALQELSARRDSFSTQGRLGSLPVMPPEPAPPPPKKRKAFRIPKPEGKPEDDSDYAAEL